MLTFNVSFMHFDTPLFLIFLGVLIWIPIPLGSVSEASRAFLCGLICLLACLWCLLVALGKTQPSRALRKSAPVFGLWLLFLVYLVGQAFIEWPVSEHDPLWRALGDIPSGSEPAMTRISVDRQATLLSLTFSLALTLMFGLTLALINSPKRLRLLAYVLFLSGVVQAAYGIYSALNGLETQAMGAGVAHGTFYNRNHFAGYLEMTLAVGIGLMTGSPRLHRQLQGWRDRVQTVISFFLSAKSSIRIGILIMALGLVLSRSRMGNGAFLGSLTAVGLLFAVVSSGTFRTRMIVLWVSILVVDITFLGSYFGLQELQQRIEQTTTQEVQNRVDISDHLIPYVVDYFPLGSGLGTLGSAFTPYYTADMTADYPFVEDDYLEFLGELGVGVIPLGMLVVLSFIATIQAAKPEHPIFRRGMAFASAMALISLLIHSAVDFNLQIPANALTFVVLLAIAWVVRFMSFDEAVSPVRKRHRRSRGDEYPRRERA